jgi:ubiquinone/menaquinone biosynthesis C-methylase UbiE
MSRACLFASTLALCLSIGAPSAQAPPAQQTAQERAQAELDTPKLVEVLELKPGMTVADVGAGFGAMTVVLGKWIGSGHVYATDIAERQLGVIRDYAKREGLTNVTVLEGAAATTNLPEACCDAIFLQHVYHHITAIEAFNRSVQASLKPGGRVAIIDFVAKPGSDLPEGVPSNRGGHGVPTGVVIDEMSAAGLVHVRTIDKWPPGDKDPAAFLALFRKPG